MTIAQASVGRRHLISHTVVYIVPLGLRPSLSVLRSNIPTYIELKISGGRRTVCTPALEPGHQALAVLVLPGLAGVCTAHEVHSLSPDENQGTLSAFMSIQTSLKDFLFPSGYLDICVMWTD